MTAAAAAGEEPGEEPGDGSAGEPTDEPGDESVDGAGTPTGAPRIRPVIGGRSAARERAVHLLYEAEMTDHSGTEVLAGQIVAADRYTEELVAGVDAHTEELDALLGELAPPGWTTRRMATLDRNVLRVACYELSRQPDVPTGVVLSEAVSLAETYGSDESPRFVNGLLAAAARRLRPEV